MGHCDIVKILLDNGAKFDICDGEPLRLACKRGHCEIVKILLDKGAKINISDKKLLNNACEKGYLK